MDLELHREINEWATQMRRDLRRIIEQIAANNQRIEQLRHDLHRDMNAGFDGMMAQFSDLHRELAELIDRGTPG